MNSAIINVGFSVVSLSKLSIRKFAISRSTLRLKFSNFCWTCSKLEFSNGLIDFFFELFFRSAFEMDHFKWSSRSFTEKSLLKISSAFSV